VFAFCGLIFAKFDGWMQDYIKYAVLTNLFGNSSNKAIWEQFQQGLVGTVPKDLVGTVPIKAKKSKIQQA
jgi:hypothetical protein